MSVREALRERQDEARVRRMWSVIDRERQPTSRGWFVAAGMACAVGVAVFFFGTRSAPGPLATEEGAALPGRFEGAGEVAFSDGSRIVRSEEATLEVLENSADEMAFALRTGSARFEVEPGGPRRWRVVASGVEVFVVGTVFDVRREGDELRVEVSRGTVRVRSPGARDGEQRLDAGESLAIRIGPARPASSLAVAPVRVEAVEDVETSPPVEVLATPSLTSLLDAADEARARRDHREAVRLLQRGWREHPRDARAPLAAFTQGRLELDQLTSPAAAAETLTRSLAMGLQAPLRETALALRVEAWGRAGDARARSAAEDFLATHPTSDYRARVARWASEEAP